MRSTRPDCIDGVGHQPGGDGDGPAQQEGEGHAGISPKNQRLQSIVESEVHSTVDEDTDSRDGESSVETLDSIRLQSLDVDINESVELSLASLALGVIGQPKIKD